MIRSAGRYQSACIDSMPCAVASSVPLPLSIRRWRGGPILPPLGMNRGRLLPQLRTGSMPEACSSSTDIRSRRIGAPQTVGTYDVSETLDSIGKRLDSIQNSVSAMNRRLITLENSLAERVGALEASAEAEDRADQVVDRMNALEISVNHLILLVERIAKAQGVER